MRILKKREVNKIKKAISLLITFVLTLSPLFWFVSQAQAATLSGGSTLLSKGNTSATSVSYDFDFSNVTTSSIKCIKVVLSDAATGGSAPTGINTASVTYNASNSDYVPDSETWVAAELASGSFKITTAAGEVPASATDATVQVTGITNGSTADTTYFAQFSTYDNIDCSSSAVDSGVVAFIYTAGQAVSLTVDPSISFSVAGIGVGQSVNGSAVTVLATTTTIPFSTVTDSANAIAAHDVTVSTNASGGYTVYVQYTAVPTNGGSDTITDFTGTNSSPTNFSAAGTEAFGYTTEDAVLATGTPGRFVGGNWAKFTNANLEAIYSDGPVSNETIRLGYQVGVAGNTEAGIYTTTVILTATPVY